MLRFSFASNHPLVDTQVSTGWWTPYDWKTSRTALCLSSSETPM